MTLSPRDVSPPVMNVRYASNEPELGLPRRAGLEHSPDSLPPCRPRLYIYIYIYMYTSVTPYPCDPCQRRHPPASPVPK